MDTTREGLSLETPPSLVELRRDLHRHPELRFDLRRTAALVEERLRDARWDVRSGIATSGILATRTGPAVGPHVMLRADMDGLPVSETNSVPYASTSPGVMHACGHDVHTSVMVGVAERLAAETLPRGRLSLVFQPAEEMPYGEPSGALTMLEEGLFREDPPDVVIALHCWPSLPAGSIGIDERIAMGGKDAFHIALRGVTAHAATPSGGRDAILGMAQLVGALHQGIARSLDPSDLAAFNIGTMRGGTSQSVVSESAEITGTIRTVDADVRARLRAVVERITQGVAGAAGLDHRLTWSEIVPAIENDPRLIRCGLEVGRELLGEERTVRLTVPPMTADDFAFFAQLAPALYFKLGTCGEGPCPPLHHSAFDPDERAIGVGIAVMSELARRLLDRPLEAWGAA